MRLIGGATQILPGPKVLRGVFEPHLKALSHRGLAHVPLTPGEAGADPFRLPGGGDTDPACFGEGSHPRLRG